jgi:hypothetical protein
MTLDIEVSGQDRLARLAGTRRSREQIAGALRRIARWFLRPLREV